jgi:hypothetical protein
MYRKVARRVKGFLCTLPQDSLAVDTASFAWSLSLSLSYSLQLVANGLLPSKTQTIACCTSASHSFIDPTDLQGTCDPPHLPSLGPSIVGGSYAF